MSTASVNGASAVGPGARVATAASSPDATHRLVGRAQAGDTGAFEALYRGHAGRVYAVCLRLTGRPHIAEELTQETFVRAWSRLPRFRHECQFATWLHRIAVNLVLDERRAHTRREARIEQDEDLASLAAPGSLRRVDEALDLERAVAALPDGARTVFVLHDLEGYRHQEIAALTGVAVGTSKAQLHRARRLLREALEP